MLKSIMLLLVSSVVLMAAPVEGSSLLLRRSKAKWLSSSSREAVGMRGRDDPPPLGFEHLEPTPYIVYVRKKKKISL